MLGEFAPFAIPQLDGLFVAALVVFGAVVAMGGVKIIRGFALGVIGGTNFVLHGIPVVGGLVESGLTHVAQWLDSAFTAAIVYLDGVVAAFWRDLSRLASWVWHEVAGGAQLHHVASRVLHATATATLARGTIRHLTGRMQALTYDVAQARRELNVLERELDHAGAGRIGAAVHAGTSPLDHRIAELGSRLTGTLGAVEHELGVVIPGEFGTLREWANRVTDELAATRARVQAIETGAVAVTGTAAVALAMRELGTEWTRCRNWRNLGRGLCGLPSSLIEGLLGLGVDALLVANLCYFAQLVEDAAVTLEPVLDELVNVQAFVCLFGGATVPSGIVAADRRGSGGLAAGIVAGDLTA